MPRDKVNSKLARIMAEEFHLDSEKISIDDSVDTIEGWDSLGHIELILAIEEAFDVKFSTELIRKLVSVKALQNALRKNGSA